MLKNGKKLLFLAVFAVLMYTDLKAQEILTEAKGQSETMSSVSSYDLNKIEELFVEGERPTGADLDLIEMDRVYRWKETAARSFKSGQYEKAFPQLLFLARMGFKDSQARVAYIYLHGLGGQKKSNIEALGWLGVASTGETRPAYRNMFKEMMAQIPSAHREMVNAHVQSYREKYGADKMGIQCSRSRTGHISKFLCRYTAEMDQHQIRMMMMMAATLDDSRLPWAN